MIRLVGVMALAAAPALGAEGGAIKGGEHVGFSRIVMSVEPTTEWSLETGEGRATIHFPGKALSFATDRTFEMLPKTRIQAVRAEAGPAGTTVDVALSCDCRVFTLAGARFLALDVADPGVVPDPDAVEALPAPEGAGDRQTREASPAPEGADLEAREASAVSSAEAILIEQIERAASQGLIELSAPAEPSGQADGKALPDPVDPAQPAAPGASEALTLPLRAEADGAEAGVLALLMDHEQIRATTVFDRDGQSALERAAEPAVPPECLPDEALDVGAWSNGLPLHAQTVTIGQGLVGEFDAPDPIALRDLARIYVHFGFGAEAESLIASFDAALEERQLLVDLARAVDGRSVSADGPLGRDAACPGRHGLWLALGGVAPVFHDQGHFAGVQAAFAELPPELRALLGPGLIGRLLDAGRVGEARLIYDTAARPGSKASAEMRLAEARLVAVEGHPVEGIQALDALVAENAPNAVEALRLVVGLALDAGIPVPERAITDLRAAAVQHRGSGLEAPLRRLLAEALAGGAALGEAVDEIRSARADLPSAASDLDALAVRLLAEADPEAVGAAAYAEVMLAAAELIAPARANDPARRAIGERLIELGLPDAALAMLAPAAARGDAATRLLAARAQMRLGHGEAARAVLGDLPGPEAAALRARAFALGGDFEQAASTLIAEGLSADAEPYVWPAGDWPRARDAAERPDREAMAGYMAARESGAEPPAPAPDPAALAPEAAFQEPLPSLAPPSLDAARRLLSAGRQVEGFVERLLDEE